VNDSYEEVPYPGAARAQTHPDRLATLATLFGMRPAPPEHCRVLELGCGDASNLIPMAFGLPRSMFTGIDLSPGAIAKGRRIVEALGLGNITLACQNLMELGPELGEFDYIIAHGVYSWVPSEVRDRVLTLIETHLAANGVAYVSYNTLPGAYFKQMMREMMFFHLEPFAAAAERLTEAFAFVRSLAACQRDSDEIGRAVRSECERILDLKPGHLYHDELAETNAPVYFYQFVEHARRHGLQYLAEADFHQMQPPAAPQVFDLPHLPPASDLIRREQYFDFVRCRRFRRTLLVRDRVALERSLDPRRIPGMFLASPVEPVSPKPDLRLGKVEKFRLERGGKVTTFSTGSPLAKAALLELGATWPGNVRLDELARRALGRLPGPGASGEDVPAAVGKLALELYAANVAQLNVRSLDLVTRPGERPVASRLARYQLHEGTQCVNLLHVMVETKGEEIRRLLLLLDGTRDRAALREQVSKIANKEISEEQLDQALGELARLALLVA